MSGLPCPDCFKGSKHEGEPRGITTTIHGLPTYVASPPEGVTPKGIIVHITDAFGWEFVNNRNLCDHYAERGGFLVYMPDFMNGRSLPWPFVTLVETKIKGSLPWLETIFYKPIYAIQALSMILPFIITNRRSVARDRVFAFFAALRGAEPPFPTEGGLKIGAAGFCWGGLYTILLAADEPSSRVRRHGDDDGGVKPLIDCGFTAHPSLVKMPGDIEAVTIPLSVAIGDDDMYMKGPVILQMKDVLEKKEGQGHEVHIMPGAKHGFAIRTDPDDAFQMECAERAEVQALEFFGRWFK